MADGAAKYTDMQRNWYQTAAGASRYDADTKSDGVVGSYDEHNEWPDYDKYLMKYVDGSFESKLALDFACGPGRNIVKYNHLFKRIDGADIAQANITNAEINLSHHGLPIPNLYVTSGSDCGEAVSNTYDFVFSTIAMQHICVHEVRFSILRDMYRILRKRGRLSIQMGFGYSEGKASYFDNHYDAIATNSGFDTMVENSDYIESDLRQIGFENFEYWVRPRGPGDSHPNWIFFTATK